MLLWSCILALSGIVSMWVAGRSKWGWIMGIGTQVMWVIYSLLTGQLGFIISCVGFAWVYYVNFKRGAIKNERNPGVDSGLTSVRIGDT